MPRIGAPRSQPMGTHPDSLKRPHPSAARTDSRATYTTGRARIGEHNKTTEGTSWPSSSTPP
ncbi:hypothetical protein GCM10010216_25610 [Streptomyces flaveolus]|nr:hypothetical protein GCM10010216_25610 [Streptomyces flaveolus]